MLIARNAFVARMDDANVPSCLDEHLSRVAILWQRDAAQGILLPVASTQGILIPVASTTNMRLRGAPNCSGDRRLAYEEVRR